MDIARDRPKNQPNERIAALATTSQRQPVLHQRLVHQGRVAAAHGQPHQRHPHRLQDQVRARARANQHCQRALCRERRRLKGQ